MYCNQIHSLFIKKQNILQKQILKNTASKLSSVQSRQKENIISFLNVKQQLTIPYF